MLVHTATHDIPVLPINIVINFHNNYAKQTIFSVLIIYLKFTTTFIK